MAGDQGVAVFTPILEGCAVQMDFQVPMMGTTMHGISVTVYTRRK